MNSAIVLEGFFTIRSNFVETNCWCNVSVRDRNTNLISVELIEIFMDKLFTSTNPNDS